MMIELGQVLYGNTETAKKRHDFKLPPIVENTEESVLMSKELCRRGDFTEDNFPKFYGLTYKDHVYNQELWNALIDAGWTHFKPDEGNTLGGRLNHPNYEKNGVKLRFRYQIAQLLTDYLPFGLNVFTHADGNKYLCGPAALAGNLICLDSRFYMYCGGNDEICLLDYKNIEYRRYLPCELFLKRVDLFPNGLIERQNGNQE